MRPICTKMKRPEDPENLYKTFVELNREYLHIILCMSPIGDALRVRCRKFPSLVDCCTLDWFSPWPSAALISVATKIIKDDVNFPEPKGELSMEKLIEGISFMCKEVHESATV